MDLLKYKINKAINKEEDLLKILQDGCLSKTAEEFTEGRINGLRQVLKIIEKEI